MRVFALSLCLLMASVNLQANPLSSLVDSVSGFFGFGDNPLVSALTEQLGVSDDQAAGGTSALLSLAQNSLGEGVSGLGMLEKLIPEGAGGLDSSLLSSISSMGDVSNIFSSLGMDAGMVQQFIPVILGYLEKSGGEGLVGQLSSLWNPASNDGNGESLIEGAGAAATAVVSAVSAQLESVGDTLNVSKDELSAEKIDEGMDKLKEKADDYIDPPERTVPPTLNTVGPE